MADENGGRKRLTTEEHKARHVMLHEMLDELVADFIAHTKQMPSSVSVMDLMAWSALQASSPDELNV